LDGQVAAIAASWLGDRWSAGAPPDGDGLTLAGPPMLGPVVVSEAAVLDPPAALPRGWPDAQPASTSPAIASAAAPYRIIEATPIAGFANPAWPVNA